MGLVLQITGAAAAGAAFAAIVGGRVTRAGYRTGLVAVVVAGACLLYAWHLFPTLNALEERRERDARVPLATATVAGGTEAGVDTAFVEWLRARLRPGERFFVLPDGPRGDAATYQWITFRLMPNVGAERAADADVLVFLADPAQVYYDHARFGSPVEYAGGRAVVRARDAR